MRTNPFTLNEVGKCIEKKNTNTEKYNLRLLLVDHFLEEPNKNGALKLSASKNAKLASITEIINEKLATKDLILNVLLLNGSILLSNTYFSNILSHFTDDEFSEFKSAFKKLHLNFDEYSKINDSFASANPKVLSRWANILFGACSKEGIWNLLIKRFACAAEIFVLPKIAYCSPETRYAFLNKFFGSKSSKFYINKLIDLGEFKISLLEILIHSQNPISQNKQLASPNAISSMNTQPLMKISPQNFISHFLGFNSFYQNLNINNNNANNFTLSNINPNNNNIANFSFRNINPNNNNVANFTLRKINPNNVNNSVNNAIVSNKNNINASNPALSNAIYKNSNDLSPIQLEVDASQASKLNDSDDQWYDKIDKLLFNVITKNRQLVSELFKDTLKETELVNYTYGHYLYENKLILSIAVTQKINSPLVFLILRNSSSTMTEYWLKWLQQECGGYEGLLKWADRFINWLQSHQPDALEQAVPVVNFVFNHQEASYQRYQSRIFAMACQLNIPNCPALNDFWRKYLEKLPIKNYKILLNVPSSAAKFLTRKTQSKSIQIMRNAPLVDIIEPEFFTQPLILSLIKFMSLEINQIWMNKLLDSKKSFRIHSFLLSSVSEDQLLIFHLNQNKIKLVEQWVDWVFLNLTKGEVFTLLKQPIAKSLSDRFPDDIDSLLSYLVYSLSAESVQFILERILSHGYDTNDILDLLKINKENSSGQKSGLLNYLIRIDDPEKKLSQVWLKWLLECSQLEFKQIYDLLNSVAMPMAKNNTILLQLLSKKLSEPETLVKWLIEKSPKELIESSAEFLSALFENYTEKNELRFYNSVILIFECILNYKGYFLDGIATEICSLIACNKRFGELYSNIRSQRSFRVCHLNQGISYEIIKDEISKNKKLVIFTYYGQENKWYIAASNYKKPFFFTEYKFAPHFDFLKNVLPNNGIDNDDTDFKYFREISEKAYIASFASPAYNLFDQDKRILYDFFQFIFEKNYYLYDKNFAESVSKQAEKNGLPRLSNLLIGNSLFTPEKIEDWYKKNIKGKNYVSFLTDSVKLGGCSIEHILNMPAHVLSSIHQTVLEEMFFVMPLHLKYRIDNLLDKINNKEYQTLLSADKISVSCNKMLELYQLINTTKDLIRNLKNTISNMPKTPIDLLTPLYFELGEKCRHFLDLPAGLFHKEHFENLEKIRENYHDIIIECYRFAVENFNEFLTYEDYESIAFFFYEEMHKRIKEEKIKTNTNTVNEFDESFESGQYLDASFVHDFFNACNSVKKLGVLDSLVFKADYDKIFKAKNKKKSISYIEYSKKLNELTTEKKSNGKLTKERDNLLNRIETLEKEKEILEKKNKILKEEIGTLKNQANQKQPCSDINEDVSGPRLFDRKNESENQKTKKIKFERDNDHNGGKSTRKATL